ncbi:Protein MHF1 homolog [Linum grandiflorum]
MDGSDLEREEADSVGELLKDRFRLSAISVVESQGRKNGMEVSETVTACISDLALKFTEQLAKDLELFAQHGGRKCVNMDDVLVSTHRNDNLSSLLRPLSSELRGKEHQSERKRKKTSKKEDTNTSNVVNLLD